MKLAVRNFTRTSISTALLGRIAREFARQENLPQEAEVSLVLVGNRRIRNLNRKWRGLDKATDVLSFEGDFHFSLPRPQRNVQGLYMGEILIAVPMARKQARLHGHSLQKELSVLFVHGLMHLIGYDHLNDADFALMNAGEKRLLKAFYKQRV